ncbi:uncharacterized protein PAC_13441 [Phialocephala subalpina]|uniref:Cysteine-rich transmembrane domain-containing protein n=1 Tax=Phialocephala subalpina TaxID=576137 RepID=A0A1L7XEU5_9HELO|nr:uncharacterized protein PAC_13441 [Phialocephala subalpina]
MFPTKPQQSAAQQGYKLQDVPLQAPGQQIVEQHNEQSKIRGGKGDGCLAACLATLCCCCVAEEGCEACADCAICAEGCC